MSVLPVKDNKVQLTETVGTVYQNGVLMDGEKATYATASPVTYSNGIQRTATGAIYCVDATAGLPAGYTWCNGLPFSILGALCISNNAVASWSNGIPFDVNGAVVADYMPTPVLSIDFTTGTLDSRITFTRASGGTRVNSYGAIELMTTNTPRFDYDPVTLAAKGLLIEEQRTNYIRNNSMVGAVAGAPGTLPTNWSINGAGTTTTIVGTGTNNGIPYMDVRFNGTKTLANALSMTFDSNVSATNGQVYSASYFLSVVSGSTSGITDYGISANIFSASSSYLGEASFVGNPQLSGVTSEFKRFTGITGTVNNASAATIRPYIYFSAPVGAAIDITLRIGYPQLELGSFATSVIPTSGAQATRAADVAVVTGTNFSSWYNQSEGTIYAEAYKENQTATNTVSCAAYSDVSNRIEVRYSGVNATDSRFEVVALGVAEMSGNAAAGSSTRKSSTAYKLNNSIGAVNGNLSILDTSVNIPSSLTTFQIGASSVGGYLNGHIKAIKYFNTRLPDSQLQTLTV